MMEIVIKIDEEDYNLMKVRVCKSSSDYLILDGTPLPKHHGRLIDADKLSGHCGIHGMSGCCGDCDNCGDYVIEVEDIKKASTIIEGSESE